jgi:hypothetical protein
MKLRNKPHDIPLHLLPKILDETEVDPIGSRALKAIAIPDRVLDLRLRERSDQTTSLNHRQAPKTKVLHPRPLHIPSLEVSRKMGKHRLTDVVHPFQGDAVHLDRRNGVSTPAAS